MAESKINRKLIFKNTLYLYLRMLLTLGVTLLSSRIVLNQLGVNDYGIYGLVGGIITIFSFLNNSMSLATSRYMTVENVGRSRRRPLYTFNSAMLIHIGVALIVLILAETVGLWMVMCKLNIAPERHTAAMWVYQLSVLGTMIGITQVPYGAAILAHERMDIYAKYDVLGAVLRLLVALSLYFTFFDSLIYYAIMMSGISIVTAVIYRVFCIRHFHECRFSFKWMPSVGKSLMSFSGWNLYSNFCFVGRQQGTNIVLNLFGGTAINAAAGLAANLTSIINSIATNLISASRPQIIGQYAMGKYNEMIALLSETNLLANCLYLVVAIPFLAEIDYILTLWLKNVPEYLVPFAILTIVEGFFRMNNNVVVIAIQAVGKIKFYSIASGTISIALLPILWIIMKNGGGYEWAFLLPIISKPLSYSLCVVSFKKSVSTFNIPQYVWHIMVRSLAIGLPATIAVIFLKYWLEPSLVRVLLSCIFAIVFFGISALTFGLPYTIRTKVSNILLNKIKSFA